MNKSTDPGYFFQSDASQTNYAKKIKKSRNKNGNPIVLRSKILNAIPDPHSTVCIYIAESAGCVRKINIRTREVKTVYRGPSAPITSVAIGGANLNTVFAACWDKDIWSWGRETQLPSKKYKGHSDFVKTIVTARFDGQDILISGGADSKIIVWDTATGTRLYTIRDEKDTMLSLQDLAIDPRDSAATEIVLFSASSDPIIRKWRLNYMSGIQLPLDGTPVGTLFKEIKFTQDGININEHNTSVYRIFFSDDEDSDLWTSSADGTAKCLSRTKNWCAEETYEHKDYVCAVVVREDLVITAGRDEDLKVWDRATGKLYHVFEGHFDEVTALVLVEEREKVVSVSIDGTVRCWELGNEEMEKEIKKKKEQNWEDLGNQEGTLTKLKLSAEEITELAELMSSEDITLESLEV